MRLRWSTPDASEEGKQATASPEPPSSPSAKGFRPFHRHNFDARWAFRTLTYFIDVSDFPPAPSAASVDAALVSAYETWDAVRNVTLTLTRVPDNQSQPRLLDAVIPHRRRSPACHLYDAPRIVSDDRRHGPSDCQLFADISWMAAGSTPDYFEKCLGSGDIIAVTWTFSDPADLNHDNTTRSSSTWSSTSTHIGAIVTTGSVFLDPDGPFDIQSIFVHEDGHALGLDHNGGPNHNQPFMLQPNGRVFDPGSRDEPVLSRRREAQPFPPDSPPPQPVRRRTVTGADRHRRGPSPPRAWARVPLRAALDARIRSPVASASIACPLHPSEDSHGDPDPPRTAPRPTHRPSSRSSRPASRRPSSPFAR